jgi:REP element-mobilizing transposase RayT
MHIPGSHRLRLGRRSLPNHIYLCTAKTHGRARFLSDLYAARAVIGQMRLSDARGRTSTFACVVMPDHFHWLLQLHDGASLQSVMRDVKSYAAKRINEQLRRRGPVWQSGFHDHCVRREESLERLASYVIANPLRAGLASDLGDFPHWHAGWELL